MAERLNLHICEEKAVVEHADQPNIVERSVAHLSVASVRRAESEECHFTQLHPPPAPAKQTRCPESTMAPSRECSVLCGENVERRSWMLLQCSVEAEQ